MPPKINHSTIKNSNSVVNSALRAIDVLEEIASSPKPLTVREVASKCGMSRPTAYRYLTSLATRGYVLSLDDNYYELGTRLLSLGSKLLERFDWLRLAIPYIKELSAISGETVFVGILDGIEILYVAKIESQHSIRMQSAIGTRNPIYCTSMGKAVLSRLSVENLNSILDKVHLIARTSSTITNRARLMDEIDKVRKDGFAFDRMENEDGVHCVGAPILDYTRMAIGGISVSGPAYRLEIPKLTELAPAVVNIASAISNILGYTPQ